MPKPPCRSAPAVAPLRLLIPTLDQSYCFTVCCQDLAVDFLTDQFPPFASATMIEAHVSLGEIDCLAALWEAKAEGRSALQLKEIHRRIADRRRRSREAELAPTTVSTHLRTLVAKKLITPVVLQGPASSAQSMLPPTRSPRTAYRANQEAGQVLKRHFKRLADAYPAPQRLDALADIARAFGLPEEMVSEIEKLARQMRKTKREPKG